MKHLTVCIAFFSYVALNAAKLEVPILVSKQFASMFPGAVKVKWEKEGSNYEAEFKLNGSEYSAEFTSEGVWLETAQELLRSQLPPALSQELDSLYGANTIEEIELVEAANMGKHYEIEIEGKPFDLKLVYSLTGEFLTKEEIKPE